MHLMGAKWVHFVNNKVGDRTLMCGRGSALRDALMSLGACEELLFN